MKRRLHANVVHTVLAVGLAAAWCLAAGSGPVVAQDPIADSRLDEIRRDLVQLKFEDALTAIEALLSDPGLQPAERIEAYILRSQTHVALGDLGAAEKDYLEILRRRPTYAPDASLTPNKALQRFEAVRKATIGRLRVVLLPPDAVLTVNGAEATPAEDGVLVLAAGEYTLRGDRVGYDPEELTARVLPGQEQPVELRLVPNSRSVTLFTEPEGVEVFLDGTLVGVTVRPERLPGASLRPARLDLENLEPGEHEFEMRLPCHRTELRRDILTVDLLDNSAKHYELVTLQPSLVTIILEGGPEGAEVTIDGESIGRLPVDPHPVCPGARDIVVSQRGRTLWSIRREFEGSTENRLPVAARPNAVVFAAAWPAELSALREEFNTELREWPAGTNLSTPEDFAGLGLSDDTDLVIAVRPSDHLGAGDRWHVYSPILRAIEQRGRIGDELSRPDWTTHVWGVATADSAIGGDVVVVEVAAASPAAAVGPRVGDRVVAVDGRPVSASAVLARAFEEARAGRKPAVELEWTDAAGQRRKATVPAVVTPELSGRSDSLSRDAARAAWAVIDTLAADEPAALANLALLFAGYGHPQSAVETWKRVRWNARDGIGDGTTQYYVGHELVERGDEAAAIEAYRRAAASGSTAFTDLGPRVGPAAVDCLADLGVAR